jgi:hypothetical protein
VHPSEYDAPCSRLLINENHDVTLQHTMHSQYWSLTLVNSRHLLRNTNMHNKCNICFKRCAFLNSVCLCYTRQNKVHSTITSFWNNAPCNFVEVNRRFWCAYRLHHLGDGSPYYGDSRHLWNLDLILRGYTDQYPRIVNFILAAVKTSNLT